MLDIDDLRSRFLNLEFDTTDFRIAPENVLTVARACGETRPEYIDPTHPEFQAYPAYLASLASGRRLPIDFPSLGGIPIDGGKAVECHLPVPVDTPITGRTHLHEIYDKSGRSGRMIFLVSRMELFDAQNNHLATTDSRLVVRERPDAGEA